MFPSWQSYQTWVVLPQGCPTAGSATSCTGDRGGTFNPNSSSTWDNHGFYSLAIEENLGVTGNAQYGFDTVALGSDESASKLPVVKNSTVGALAVNSYYLGILGLDPKPTNWTSFSDQSPSLMSLMKQQSLIPSISLGYTAGAQYRNVGGSLTLGGYDSSRLVENDVVFKFAIDNARYTVVNLRSITTPKSGSTGISELLNAPMFAMIDSTIAEFWLPVAVCKAFETEFGLKYDQTTQLYLVDQALHTSLLARNASITFKLAPDANSGATVDIVLPYAAFDLTAKPPYASLNSSILYFPLRRAQNDTQYTLGRTFMQEAYVSVDYSLQEFNVSQAAWGTESKLVTIPQSQPLSGSFSSVSQGLPPNKTTPLKGPAIAGIAIGAIAALVATGIFLIWYFRRRQQRKRATIISGTMSEKHASSSRSRGYFDGASEASDDSRTLFSAGGASSIAHGSRVYAKYADSLSPSDTRSPMSEDKLLSPYSPGSPGTPFSGREAAHQSFSDRGSVLKSAVSPGITGLSPLRGETPVVSAPAPAIWAGEKDSGQIFEMPGSVPAIAQADSKELSPTEAMARRSPLADHNAHMQSSDAVGGRHNVTSISSAATSRYSGDARRFTPAVPPKLNIGPAREVISSPVSALTPSTRRGASQLRGMIPEHPPPLPGSDLGVISPASARTPASLARQRVYGTGDDDEYQSPAF